MFFVIYVGVEEDAEADEVAPGTETAPGAESSVTSQVIHYPFNPLSPNSDQHQISPCNINANCTVKCGSCAREGGRVNKGIYGYRTSKNHSAVTVITYHTN